MLTSTTKRSQILCIVIAFFFIFFGFDGATQFLVALYAREGQQYIAFNSQIILYLSFLIANIYCTKLIRPFGLKKSMMIGVTMYFLYIFSLLSKNTLFIYPMAALNGIGATLLWTSSRQFIALHSSKDDLGKYLSFQFSSFMFGTLFGSVVGAILISRVPFHVLYSIFSGTILIAIPFFVMISADKDSLPEMKFRAQYVFKPHMLLMFPFIFAVTFLSSQTQNGINLIVLSRFGLSAVGTVAVLLKTTIVIGSLLAGLLLTKISHEKTLAFLAGAGILGILFTLVGFTPVILGLGIVGIGIYISSTLTQSLALLRRVVNVDEYVFAISASQVYQCLAALASLSSAKYLQAEVSLLPGLLIALCSLPALWIFKKKHLNSRD